MTHPLKQSRLDRKLTLKQAGEQIGVGAMSFYRFENGERIPDRETMPIVCSVFGLQPNDFYPTPMSSHTSANAEAAEAARAPP